MATGFVPKSGLRAARAVRVCIICTEGAIF